MEFIEKERQGEKVLYAHGAMPPTRPQLEYMSTNQHVCAWRACVCVFARKMGRSSTPPRVATYSMVTSPAVVSVCWPVWQGRSRLIVVETTLSTRAGRTSVYLEGRLATEQHVQQHAQAPVVNLLGVTLGVGWRMSGCGTTHKRTPPGYASRLRRR